MERQQNTVKSLEELNRQSKITYTVLRDSPYLEYFQVTSPLPLPGVVVSVLTIVIAEHEERRGGSLHQVEGDDAEQRGGGHQVNNQLVQSQSLSLTQILLSSDIESGMFSECRLSKILMKF